MRLTALLLATMLAMAFCEEKRVELTPIQMEKPGAATDGQPAGDDGDSDGGDHTTYIILEQPPVLPSYGFPSYGYPAYTPQYAYVSPQVEY